MEDFVKTRLHDIYDQHKDRPNVWQAVKEDMGSMYGMYRSSNAWRKAYAKNVRCNTPQSNNTNATNRSVVERKSNGTIEDTAIISATKEELADDTYLLKKHGYDPDRFELVWSKHSEWNSQLKGGTTTTYYSSKITVRKRTTPSALDIITTLENIKPMQFKAIVKAPRASGRMLELTLADVHANALSWRGTTGEDYDLNIACERVRDVIDCIESRMGDERFDSIIVPFGQDLFNADNSLDTTHHGTPQTNDTRLPKVVEHIIELFVEIVDRMRRHTDLVRVVLVQGNHDEDVSMMTCYALKAYFRNHSDVSVDVTAMKRKYIQHNSNMICIGHFCDDAKQIPTIMASEAPVMWGETKFREMHGAHLHKESVVDYGGFTLRRAPSISSISEWSYGKGYGCNKRHETYVWGDGLEEIWFQNII